MSRRRAFTLIELLTVIALIGVLGSLATVAGTAARARAQTAKCLSNLRQIGAAAQLYVHENRGRLPATRHERDENGETLSWVRTLRPYLGPDFIGRCPAWPNHLSDVSYGWNDLLVNNQAGLSFTQCRTPSATLMIAETMPDYKGEHLHLNGASRGVTPAYFKNESNTNIQAHGSSANYLFVDGHVSTLSWAEVQRRLSPMPSPFVNP